MPQDNTINVWDPLVRVFHWSLVAGFSLAYVSGESEGELHALAGYTLGTLLSVRLVWGVVGPQHARFSDFVYRPSEILRYLNDLFTGRPRRYLGHNPAGGAMVVLLLLSLIVATVSGVAVYGSEPMAGPLAGWAPSNEFGQEVLEELHELSAHLCLLLVFVHVAGVLIAGLLHGENLIGAMWTGRKAREL